MLDVFIWGVILLSIICFLLGKNFFDFGLILLAAALFFIVGILVLTSGWETFNQGEFVIQDVNASTTGCLSDDADCILVQPRLITYEADLATNPEVYGFAIALMGLGFIMALNGLQVKGQVDAARQDEEEE